MDLRFFVEIEFLTSKIDLGFIDGITLCNELTNESLRWYL